MRRLSLSAKLFIAALPLLVTIGALLSLSFSQSLRDVNDARRGAELGATWDPLIHTIRSIETEQTVSEGGDATAIAEARRVTNQAMVAMNNAVEGLGDSQALTLQLGQALTALNLGREAFDTPALAEARNTTAGYSYDEAENDLISLGRLLPAEAGDRQLGRELTAVAALAEVEQAGTGLVEAVGDNLRRSPDTMNFDQAQLLGSSLLESVSLFQAVAPEAWLVRFRDASFPRVIADGRRQLDQLFLYDPASGDPLPQLDLESLAVPVAQVAEFRDTLASEIVERADTSADELQRTNLIRAGITLLTVVVAGLIAMFITRSITRRVRAVSNKANEVADTQLPALVDALRDPKAKGRLPEVAPLDDRGADELGELAAAFNSVQRTLVEVASEQVEVLRRGVSDIFITMARRNRSLVDRQLALLDELEAEVDDPDVLANYYQLDHLATRMRRNSESLLVLASAEPKRRRTKATEIDDVVRAAIGEVEDYRRIDIADLESLQVRGNVVADVSHLLAELLDNAASFSPPESRVRVSGRYAGDHYLITIADEGVGIGTDRLRELNELLGEPPIVGLSVEPTLGMSVISLLANKHGVQVTLSASAPGLTVEVLLPSTLYGPIDAGKPLSEQPTITLLPPDDAIVEWTETDATPPRGSAAVDPLLDFTPPALPAVTGGGADDAAAPEPLRRSSDSVSAHVEPAEAPADPWQISSPPSDEPMRPVLPPVEPFRPDAHGDGRGHQNDSGQLPSPNGHASPEPPAQPLPGTNGDGHTDTPDGPPPPLPLGGLGPNGNGRHSEPLTQPQVEPPAGFGSTGDGHHGATQAEPDTSLDDLDLDLAALDIEPEWTKRPAPEPRTAPPAEPKPDAPAVHHPAAPAPPDAPPAAPAPTPGLPLLPPPGAAASPTSELDRPPAPPALAASPTAGPVADPDARPLPARKPLEAMPPPPGVTDAGLPIRQRSAGPEGGPDRLDGNPLTASAPPQSLQAALSAFDAGRNGQSPTLPTRQPGSSVPSDDHSRSTVPSRLDPDAIRERLRAFQQEHRSGRTSDEHDTDHGGDR